MNNKTDIEPYSTNSDVCSFKKHIKSPPKCTICRRRKKSQQLISFSDSAINLEINKSIVWKLPVLEAKENTSEWSLGRKSHQKNLVSSSRADWTFLETTKTFSTCFRYISMLGGNSRTLGAATKGKRKLRGKSWGYLLNPGFLNIYFPQMAGCRGLKTRPRALPYWDANGRCSCISKSKLEINPSTELWWIVCGLWNQCGHRQHWCFWISNIVTLHVTGFLSLSVYLHMHVYVSILGCIVIFYHHPVIVNKIWKLQLWRNCSVCTETRTAPHFSIFIIAQAWKQPDIPSVAERINKYCFLYNGTLFIR